MIYRSLGRRLLMVALIILPGMILVEVGVLYLFPQIQQWLFAIFSMFFALLAAGLGVYFDWRLSGKPRPTPQKTPEQQRLEAELFHLSQELEERSREQTAELARLNVELELQMAMHKRAEEVAHANEERFRNMADNIQEGLTIFEDGRLVYTNGRVCEIFGECPDGDIRQRIADFAVPEQREQLLADLKDTAFNGGVPAKLEYWIARQDGSRRCIRERYSKSQMHGIYWTFVVTSDITERVQAYQNLEQAVMDRTHELSTVLDISKKIASTLELEPLLYLILEQIQSIIPYTGAAIYTLEDGKLKAVAYQIPDLPRQAVSLYLTIANAGVYRQAILEKNVVIIDDVKEDPPLARALMETIGGPLPITFSHARSWIGIPLVIRDQVTGLLSLVHSEPSYYTQQHARLAMTITNQVAVAIENAGLYEQAQTLATLEERQRIARELHDSVTQLLYGICLYCTATSRSIRGGRFDLLEQNLGEIKENALQALQEMRLLIFELNPPMLQKAGLAAALQASLDGIETRTGLQTEMESSVDERLPRTIEAELYRIAMEALNNLVKHAKAKKVTVELGATDGTIYLEIRDDGVGFDLTTARASGGLGLHTMEQRASKIGGNLEVASSPGSGTRIRVEVRMSEKLRQ
ncbi:MAG: ATP-binding protein [Chloroflexota bacterium]